MRVDLSVSSQTLTRRTVTACVQASEHCEHLQQPISEQIIKVQEDLREIGAFFDVKLSNQRTDVIQRYLITELQNLAQTPFQDLDRANQIDHVLLRNNLESQLAQLRVDEENGYKVKRLVPFVDAIVDLLESRQYVREIDPQQVAQQVHDLTSNIERVQNQIVDGGIEATQFVAYQAANAIDDLTSKLSEWHLFYTDYDPLFTWWVAAPYERLVTALGACAGTIRNKLVGIEPGDKSAIIGQPIGREGLLADLHAEKIAYSPEELLEIGEEQYKWCKNEMQIAAKELGYESDWRAALEHVKNLYVPPGQQTKLVRQLADEALQYVTKNDLVTVPRVAADYWRTYMIGPEAQKTNPFFLGGPYIQVASPTSTMSHDLRMQSMRGNNIHFSRATVFHELIPGHHLQCYHMARSKPYRGSLFSTPFWIEGWALYWEMILYERSDFFKSPEDRIGTLFWRMHRCARIIFSIKFHLGEMTVQECIDMLVNWVGHERATAEGEVRRSFNGQYSPLYQAGYMIGALQIRALRSEMVDNGKWDEKMFHDRILQENGMPIEVLRALLQHQRLEPDFPAKWKFYDLS